MEEEVPISHAVSNFNIYATEFRSKVDGLVKQILLVSGGIQTITIGAFIGGQTPALSENTKFLLKNGWLCLTASIIFCLTLMLLQVIAQAHVSRKQAAKLRSLEPVVEVMNTWPALQVLNWCVGLAAFFTCVAGVFVVAKAAISLISGAVNT